MNLCFESWREGWIQRKTAYGEQQLLENLNSWEPSFWGPPITQVLSFIYTRNIHFSATQDYSRRKLPHHVWSRVRSVRQPKPILASMFHRSWGENSWQTLLKVAAHGLRSPEKQKITKTQTEKGLRFNYKMIECLRSPASHHYISRAPA